MNTYGSSGDHSHLSSIAPGPNSTAWATSQASTGGDHYVYYYPGGANGDGTWVLDSGVAFQQVSWSADVFSRNHNGTSFVHSGAAGGGTWSTIAIPTTDDNYGTSYTGQANWIAAGPEGALEAWGYIVTTTPWTGGSSDDMIVELAQSDSVGDNAFMQLPGGAVQISAAPGTGHPRAVNAEHVGFVGNIGYGYAQ
jgi:hypothetical protein